MTFWTECILNSLHGKVDYLTRLGGLLLLIRCQLPYHATKYIGFLNQLVINQIGQSVASFGRVIRTRSMHMVGWSKITKPKKYGGLGGRIARHHNTTLLGKMVCDVVTCPDKLRVSLLKSFYIEFLPHPLFSTLKRKYLFYIEFPPVLHKVHHQNAHLIMF